MSRETIEWLNANTLIGFNDKRGPAWHYDGQSDNHFDGPVPVERARSLIGFDIESEPLYRKGQDEPVSGVLAIVRKDTDAVLFPRGTESQALHGYTDWLMAGTEAIAGQELEMGSCGLLEGGAIAWCQYELPESIMGPGNVAYRPNLLATTSINQKIKSLYKPVNTIVVCDNTREMALGEKSVSYGVKHTKHSASLMDSGALVEAARKALRFDAIMDQSAAFNAELDKLLKVKVTDRQYGKWMEMAYPTEGREKRGLTMAQATHDRLWQLWEHDPMVQPWKRTAYGVIQADNTNRLHFSIVKGGKDGKSRTEKNMMDLINGATFDADALVTQQIMSIVGSK